MSRLVLALAALAPTIALLPQPPPLRGTRARRASPLRAEASDLWLPTKKAKSRRPKTRGRRGRASASSASPQRARRESLPLAGRCPVDAVVARRQPRRRVRRAERQVLRVSRRGASSPDTHGDGGSRARPRPSIRRSSIAGNSAKTDPRVDQRRRRSPPPNRERDCQHLPIQKKHPPPQVKFGSEHPIVRQTMGTTSTRDVRGTIEQVMRCADVGFDLVRITVVGMKEAQACH